MLFDIHVHTSVSPCSDLELGEIIQEAGPRGLDGVCITDHQTTAAGNHIEEGIQDNGLCVLIGMEYATPDGDFLLFGPVQDLPQDLSARELLKEVHAAGGVAIAAHPFRSNRPVQEYIMEENLCRVVESVNGRNSNRENRRIDTWRDRYDFTECCGSDAHSLAELGRHKTRFDIPVHTTPDLVFALKNGLCAPGTDG